MKYNRHDIMKAAWRYKRMMRCSMSQALRHSWAEAKLAVQANEAIDNGTVNLRICGYQCQLNKRIVADYSAMGWAVTGDTYKAKKYIKQLGFVWDSDIKAWTTTDRSVALAAAINY